MQARSEETRKRILEESARLFSTKGYEATGVAELCLASEVSKGAFYHHFPSKQSVFLALLKDWLQVLDTELLHTVDDATDVPSALLAMASEMKQVFTAADGRVQLFLEFWQQAVRDPEVWQEFIAPYRRYHEFFAGIIKRGVDEGSLRPVDPRAAAQALVSLAVGIVIQGVLDPGAAEWDVVTRDAVGLLISGMAARR
jgi:AcrR family transcriptional regulator